MEYLDVWTTAKPIKAGELIKTQFPALTVSVGCKLSFRKNPNKSFSSIPMGVYVCYNKKDY